MKTFHPEPLEAINKKRQNKDKFETCLQKRPACQTLLKAFDISSATAWVAPGLLKALAILSDTIVRRSAVDWEHPKTYWKSEKGHISLEISKTLLTIERRPTNLWF